MAGLNKLQLKGFWGKLWKGAKAVCSVVCPPIASAMEFAENQGWVETMKITFTEDVPLAEQNLLDVWDSTKFLPFFTALCTVFQNKVLNTNLTVAERLRFFNDIVLKMEAVKWYYQNYDNQLLTTPGITSRNSYLVDIFQTVYDVFYGSDLSGYPQEETYTSVNKADLSLLQIPNNYTNKVFTVFYKEFDTVPATMPTVSAIQQATPTATQIQNVVSTAVATVNSQPATNTVTNQATSSNTKKIGLIPTLVFFMGSALALSWAFKKEK